MNTKLSIFQLYAITGSDEDGETCVYIGKTKTINLRKVLSYHRRKNYLTAPLFQSNSVPEIHLIETITANSSTAYKHYIAWIRHFLENEYDVICHLGVYEDAYNLFPETEEIYSQISNRSIKELLAIPYTPPKVERIPTTLPTPSKASARLSIRIRPAEYDGFVQFCSDNALTQREGFVTLLSLAGGNEFANTLLQEQKDTAAALKSQITKLKQIPRGIRADRRLKDIIAFYQAGITQYIKDVFPQQSITTPVICHPWSKIYTLLPNRKEYLYPQGKEYFLFRFELMCYGHTQHNNAPIFLFGKDIALNTPVVLRYYAKPEFLGVRPPCSPFYYQGNIFLMGCRVTEGVADLYAALPMPILNEPNQDAASINEPPSFDDILLDAINRTRT